MYTYIAYREKERKQITFPEASSRKKAVGSWE